MKLRALAFTCAHMHVSDWSVRRVREGALISEGERSHDHEGQDHEQAPEMVCLKTLSLLSFVHLRVRISRWMHWVLM